MEFSWAHIVFVDHSDKAIRHSLGFLRNTFSHVSVLGAERDLIDLIGKEPPDIILIQYDLKPHNGIMIMESVLKNKLTFSPFIIIYADASREEALTVQCLESGADAFISFHNQPAILEPYIKNILARRMKQSNFSKFGFELDSEKHIIYKDKQPYSLPKKEHELFQYLFVNPGRFHSKKEIAQEIWSNEDIAKGRTIDVHIYNLRQIFGYGVIENQSNKGYRFNKEYSSSTTSGL